jgi:hypothetical protein
MGLFQEVNSEAPTKPVQAAPTSAVAKFLLRVLTFVVVALSVSWLETRINQAVHRQPAPAGLGIGMVDGALMPLAFPLLLAGKDVPIYAQPNTGRTYNLGYTAGVTLCGAVFFGLFFWRLSRWRSRALANTFH